MSNPQRSPPTSFGSLIGLSGRPGTASLAKSALVSEESSMSIEELLLNQADKNDEFVQNQEPGHYSHLTLEEYCKQMGGSSPISRVLIANNGIAAVKAIRSIRKWAYETFSNDKMIQFVVMATPEDLRANAEYIHLADEFVPVPGGSNNNNYANIRLITEIAENTNCHAVWAGWGHASENPKLPDLLAQTKSKVVWIGPPSHAMRALGDKIGSTLIAQSAGVPCMGWSGDGLTVNYAKSGIPDDVYRKSCVESVEEAQEQADRIGYPVMIKASEGGGGKGIRRVETPAELSGAFRQVQGEVPGSPIFIMKLAGTCRHLEVQLLCDSWGNSIAVFGRDCSIQRRHQKIIEEGPVVAAPPDIWHEMERSAVRLAKEVGYVGAGTVEYLYMEDGTYSFLELNPRLQVEHPVTELISGVNLPAAQLQIAMGIPLKRLPGIRKMYGESVLSDQDIDFDNRKAQTLPLHVIACRITAENPDEAFQPTSGVIQELNFRSTPDVWGYFSVNAKGLVHEFADSQFGHMFAVGATRDIARKNMVLALKELEIRGEIRTTIEYLRVMIEHEEFKKNKISTTWLEGILANHSISTEQPTDYLAVVCGALFRAHTYAQQQEKEYSDVLLKGHLPSSKTYQQLVTYNNDLIFQDVKYKFEVTKSGPNTYDLTLLTPQVDKTEARILDMSLENAESKPSSPSKQPKSPSGEVPPPISTQTPKWNKNVIAQCDIHNLSDGGFLVLLNGKKHVIHGREFPSGLRLTVDTMTCLFQHEYDPTSLRSDTQGKLVQFVVDNGAHVNKGDPVADLEVMKMYVTIRAPESGIITHVKNVGSVVESGDVLATFRLDDPGCVKKAQIFNSSFPEQEFLSSACALPINSNLAEQLRTYDLRLKRLLQGYIMNPQYVKDTITNLTTVLNDPFLPAVQFNVLSSNAAGRVPAPLLDNLVQVVEDYKTAVSLFNQGIFYLQPISVPEEAESGPISSLSGTLTTGTRQINEINNVSNSSTIDQPQPLFPVETLQNIIDNFLTSENVNIVAVKAALQQYGITTFLIQHKYGPVVHAIQTLFTYIHDFLSVEESFQLPVDLQATSITAPSLEDVLHHLRKVHKDNLSQVSALARAHNQFHPRCSFISILIDTLLSNFISTANLVTSVPKADLFTNLLNAVVLDNNEQTTLREEWTLLLHRLASLHEKEAIVVSLKARQALVSLRLPSQKTRLYATMRVLESALEKRKALLNISEDNNSSTGSVIIPGVSPLDVSATNPDSNANAIADLVDQTQPIDDVILHFLSHPSAEIRKLAAEAYIRRAFQHFHVTELSVMSNPTLKQLAGDLDDEQTQQVFGHTPSLLCKWQFFMEQKGTASTTDASGSILSPVSIMDNKSRGLGNNTNNNNSNSNQIPLSGRSGGFRRADSLVNLAERALAYTPSDMSIPSNGTNLSNHKENALLPSTCTETADDSDTEEINITDLTPGGMLLSSPSTIPSSLSQQSTGINTTTTSQAVSQEFPLNVCSTLKPVRRMGVLAHFNSLDELRSGFSTVLASFHDAPANRHLPRTIRQSSSLHVLYVYITTANYTTVQALSNDLNPIVSAYQSLLTQYKVRRVTFVVPLTQQTTKPINNSFSISMTPSFGAVQGPIASLSLPTPLALSKHFPAMGAIGSSNNSSTGSIINSADFLAKSVVVSPSYVTFRCTNIETPAADTNVVTTPMAKHIVSLSRPVEYVEDKAIRQIEPNNALHLQLDRMGAYDYELIPTTNRMVHLFAAIPLPPATPTPTLSKPIGNTPASGSTPAVTITAPASTAARAQYDGRRFFARVLVRRLNSVQRSRILNGKAILDSNNGSEMDVTMPSVGTADAHPETEVAFVEALNSLEIALTTADALRNGNVSNSSEILKRPGGNGKWLFNHIFVNVLVDVSIEMQSEVAQAVNAARQAAQKQASLLPDETLVNIEYVDSIIRSLTRRYADKIRRLHVTHVEFAITARVKSPFSQEINSIPIRFICENPSALVLHISPFYEQYDPQTNKVLLVPIHTRSLTNLTYSKFKKFLFCNKDLEQEPEDDLLDVPVSTTSTYLSNVHGYTDADAQYPTSFPYQRQRLATATMDTIWCFDFQEIFEKSIRRSWRTALLSYVNIFSDIAFVQTPGKDGCTVTKQEQTLIMSLLISILSVMFNYTNIDLPSAARSLRALIQAPLSVFKSAGIALILANQLNKNKTTKAYLEECVQTGDITQNDLRCIEAISSMLPSLPSHLLNTVSEFAQTAIRIPSSFISVKELVLKANPHYTNFSTATDNTTKFVQNGFSAYSSKYFLEPVSREPGLNKVAMVAFDVRLNTPECLEYDLNLELQPRGASGRDIVLISNDITIDAGSFGTEEDIVFDLASKRARELGIPRIYLAANSGARIGLADELKGKFKVAFIQGDEEYTRGFQYLYLTEKIYQEYKSSVVCKKISVELPTGEKEDRYIITDIVGKKDNLGVENLRGSGCIAGETSQAYQDVFTLTYVTCRTVGIGAYLARLGQRVIQKADPAMPLLLTGYQALNKLLGKSVYTSNVQLGGPDIMYTNGVSHQIVSNDLQGCSNIVQWLSYVPRRRVNFVSTSKDALFAKKNIFNTQSLLSQTIDPISRKPTFSPTARNQLYDPRHLLVGSTTHSPVLGLFQQFITFQKKFSALSAPVKVHSPAAASTPADLNSSIPLDDITAVLSHFQLAPIQQSPVSGLFDIFSFMEVLGGWAKGVVTGRARLGGIPVGVICVDTRTIDRTVPADPAAVDTQETVVSRAGQVWFPESSYKTAQAIFDLKAEDLPIVVLANWRGFSGGMQDMLNEILKFGSYIVDALHAIQQPIMVYLPPMSTLRGGAWVVIDPTINYDFMEMYADETSRGGVLEPEGIVDIKFRREQILLEMRRADPIIIQYNQQLIVARAANDVAQVTHITNAIKHREVALFPMYLQLATHFADLHDTPVRMQQKGCLNDVVNWETARERFYWRIKARQLEQYFVNAILAVLDKNTDDNDITVLNLQPNTNSAYQHGILHRVLTEKYKLPLFDKLQDSNTTTTHASTNQLARALVQLWFAQDIPGSKAGKNGINIPSFNVGGKSDEDFVRFVQSGFTAEGNWLQTYLDGQIGELLKFKTRTELAVMAKKFSKEELLEMLQKM